MGADCQPVLDSYISQDVVALEKKINDDLTEGRVPVLLVAYAGVCGYVCMDKYSFLVLTIRPYKLKN